MNARSAYLNYQMDMGTDEVILPYPLILNVAPLVTASQKLPHQIKTEVIPQGYEFFNIMAQTLKTSAPKPIAKKSAPVNSENTLTPQFQSLTALWEHLEQEYPRLFSVPFSVKSKIIPQPKLAVVELFPSGSQPFFSATGELLEKMLRAIHLDMKHVYLTSVMKSIPPGKTFHRKDVARMLPYFFQEMKFIGAPCVLLLGEVCCQAVLRVGVSLDSLRQKPFENENMVFTTSYHPLDLEKGTQSDNELKKKAWDDLKWLRMRLDIGAQ